MKAISLWQPWASLIAVEAKLYETRSWATRYRGVIAIHAAKRRPKASDFGSLETLQYVLKHHLNNIVPFGAIVAIAEITDCWLIDEICGSPALPGKNAYITDKELQLGDFTPGRFAWEMQNVIHLPKPIPATGKQGLWDCSADILSAYRAPDQTEEMKNILRQYVTQTGV